MIFFANQSPRTTAIARLIFKFLPAELIMNNKNEIRDGNEIISPDFESPKEKMMTPKEEAGAQHLPAGNSVPGKAASPDFARVKESYREIISLSKDTLDVAWKLAPLAFVPAALFLWIYLRALNWTGLFQESAMSGSGLIFLFVAALLIAFTVVLQFAVPSLFLIGTVSYYGYERTVPKIVPKIYKWSLGGWVIGLGLVITFDLSQAWVILLPAFLLASCVAIQNRDQFGFSVHARGWRQRPLACALLLSAVAAITMASSAFPLIIAINVAERLINAGAWAKVLAFCVCAGSSVVSFVPGFIYLDTRTWSVGVYQPLKLASLGAFFLSYVVLMIAAFSTPVSLTVLRLAGVYSNEPQTFQIIQPNLIGVLGAAGLEVRQEEKFAFVGAYVRYAFGGMRLLCKEKYEMAPIEALSEDAEDRKNNAILGAIAGSHCVSVGQGEVRPFKM